MDIRDKNFWKRNAMAVVGMLTASIIGGCGVGIALHFGGSSGEMDIVGMYFTKKFKDFSVGKVSLAVNAFVVVKEGMSISGRYEKHLYGA